MAGATIASRWSPIRAVIAPCCSVPRTAGASTASRMSRSALIGWSIRTDANRIRRSWSQRQSARPGVRRHSLYKTLGAHSRCLLEPDARAQTCALCKPNQHAQAEPVDLSVLDLGNPSLRHAEALRRLDLGQPGLAQPLVDPGQQLGAHFKLGRFFRREQVVKY